MTKLFKIMEQGFYILIATCASLVLLAIPVGFMFLSAAIAMLVSAYTHPFIGMVSYLSMTLFLLGLLAKPIEHIKRKIL